MEAELIKKFETVFKPVDRRVKDEEIILFLDKQLPQRFDRDTFSEFKRRIDAQGQDLTPANFAHTYYQAYQLLEIKKNRTFVDMNNIDRMIGRLKSSPSQNLSKLVLSNVHMDSPSDFSNYLTFEYNPDFATNIYDFSGANSHFVPVPDVNPQERIPIRISLKSPDGKVIDAKNVMIGSSELENNRTKFSRDTTVSFDTRVESSSAYSVQQELEAQKSEANQYEKFARDRHAYLASVFPDVFGGVSSWQPKSMKCGFFLIVSFVLTFLVAMIALYLNFTRCMFLDVFVTISFFANAYVWRYFNMFLAIKLIIVLVVSIILDIYWEIHKAMTFNAQYEQTVKSERIKGLILTGILIIFKLLLILAYYKLSREDQSDTILGLNQEMSVNEVAPEDYLTNPITHTDKVLNN